MAHNTDKNERRKIFPHHEIYRVEAVGLEIANDTYNFYIYVKFGTISKKMMFYQ